MAIKRSKSALSSVAVMYANILSDYGFESSGVFSHGERMKKVFVPGYLGTLTVDIFDRGANGYVSIEFDGISISKPRQMDYNDLDEKKFIARIKRVLKGAEAEAERITRRNSAKEDFATDLATIIHDRMITIDYVDPYISTHAIVVVNGYRLTTDIHLNTKFAAFGVRQEIPLEMAVNIATGLPTHVEEDDE